MKVNLSVQVKKCIYTVSQREELTSLRTGKPFSPRPALCPDTDWTFLIFLPCSRLFRGIMNDGRIIS